MTENDSHLLMSVLNKLYVSSNIVYRVERLSNDGEYLVMTSWTEPTPYVIRKVAVVDGQHLPLRNNLDVHFYSGQYVYDWEQAQDTWKRMYDKYTPAIVWDKEEGTYKEVKYK